MDMRAAMSVAEREMYRDSRAICMTPGLRVTMRSVACKTPCMISSTPGHSCNSNIRFLFGSEKINSYDHLYFILVIVNETDLHFGKHYPGRFFPVMCTGS